MKEQTVTRYTYWFCTDEKSVGGVEVWKIQRYDAKQSVSTILSGEFTGDQSESLIKFADKYRGNRKMYGPKAAYWSGFSNFD